MKIVSIAVLGIVTWIGWGAVLQTPVREDYNSGAFLYRAFCASCHGESGRGDGRSRISGPGRPI